MDDERFTTLYALVMDFAPRRGKRQQYSDALILLVFLGSVMRRKPRAWACDKRNAPRRLRDGPLPSPSQLSRRLRDPAFAIFWERFLTHSLARQQQALCLLGCFLIDAKALPVNRYTKDKQAKRGWAGDRLAKGYKLFLLCDANARIVAWQVHAMNQAEQTTALTLIQHSDRPGYVLGDSIYDTNDFYLAAAARGLQLIAPRKDPTANISDHASSPSRLHAIAMLETPNASGFGLGLYARRTQIERVFSVMASATVGLDSLPSWVRTLPRVRRWVEAMIVLFILFAPVI